MVCLPDFGLQIIKHLNTGTPLIGRFLGQEKTVLIEICLIRGVFMVKTCKMGIQEINSPHFLLFFMIFQFFEMKKQGFILTLYFVTKLQNYASRTKDLSIHFSRNRRHKTPYNTSF